ncbi:MAG: hypothetical protein RKP20_08690 [Candidatus Competibacter sp.]|nr:hypothetical protein [Candidatus Competibacter sp.]
MSLTGVEVDVATLGNIEPNTVLVVISDDTGKVRVVKVDHQSIAKDEPFLKVAADGAAVALGGCWRRINGTLVWVNPCV